MEVGAVGLDFGPALKDLIYSSTPGAARTDHVAKGGARPVVEHARVVVDAVNAQVASPLEVAEAGRMGMEGLLSRSRQSALQ